MYVARVVGSVWATRKQAPLEGGRFVMVQLLDHDRQAKGAPLAALDTVGSGPGDLVLYVTSYEAALPWFDRNPGLEVAGVDASVVAILDALPTGGER